MENNKKKKSLFNEEKSKFLKELFSDEEIKYSWDNGEEQPVDNNYDEESCHTPREWDEEKS
jgi:hypothetical protein